MTGMSSRWLPLLLVAVVLLSVVVAVVGLRVSRRPAPPPVVPVAPAPAPEPPAAEPSPPQVRTTTVTLRRGETLMSALGRLGFDRRASTDVADALRAGGADLRRMRASDELEVTWTLEGEPVSVRWESSPWLGFAAVATGGGWEVRRAETRPDARVEAGSGEGRRPPLGAGGAMGEAPPPLARPVRV